MDEFAFIESWLEEFARPGEEVIVPPGDDAAAFVPTAGHVIVATTDALVEGVHFLSDKWPPRLVGHKALAVNLSDIASMGARPRYALLALQLSSMATSRWSKQVAKGMAKALDLAQVKLIGGNVSKAGETSLIVTLLGEARPDHLLTRSGAAPGDIVWVSGTIGDSALGLESMLQRDRPPRRPKALEMRHCAPTARVALGMELAHHGAATAAVDISDGLAADLGHLLESSGVGARIDLAKLPLSVAYRRATSGRRDPLGPAVSGGEDYELLFTASPNRRDAVEAAARAARTRVTEIGRVTEGGGARLIESDGSLRKPGPSGWSHM